jgi:hypothetical protein
MSYGSGQHSMSRYGVLEWGVDFHKVYAKDHEFSAS